jgi:N-acetylglucosaminyl-diphospho-decaprenol L-rhamnosyltransferase
MFVNPDVEVRHETLDHMSILADKYGALVAPELTDADGRRQANGRGFPFLVDKFANRGLVFPGARPSLYTPETGEGPIYVAWTIGAAIGGRRRTFEALGGWDERYFLYYEDHDLGLRAWQAGHSVIVDPLARWIHGWQRETTRLAVGPWRREIASACRFFATYPVFVLPPRRRAARKHSHASAMVGNIVQIQ